ncbi:MAG: hypothetical protein R2715_24170 [Ilumatobacteraceae bacterium]
MLAPLAVRFVVIPVDDSVRAGRDAAGPLPVTDALSRQLDLRLSGTAERSGHLRRHGVAADRLDARRDGVDPGNEAGAEAMRLPKVSSGTPVFVSRRLDQVTGSSGRTC